VSPRLRRQTWVERARRRATWRSGLLVTAIIAVGVYLAFAKQLPWSSPAYQLHAVFTNATTLKQGSPVRIAGVNVGKVLSVEPAGNAAEVTFSVDSEGQPVHADATVEIRPRLFLEGNFFLDLHPGSASAPELPDGGTIPITQTSRAVQLDEILTALQEPARGDLAQVLHGFGNALTHEPTPAEDATQDPSVRGKTAAEAINQSFRYGGRAGRSTAQVSEALLGTRPHDLSELIAATANVSGTLLSREQQLKDLVTSFNRTAGALASVSGKLSETIRRLAPTLEVAQPSLRELSDALPPLRAFAIALRPSLRPLPGTIRAATPWLDQARLLLRRRELGGIARKLAVAAPNLAGAVRGSRSLFPQFDLVSRCTSEVLVPAANGIVSSATDPSFYTGQPNYREWLYGVVNFVGAGQSFDGNGALLRVGAGGGGTLVRADQPNGGFGNDSIWGYAEAPPQGTQPVVNGRHPPFRPDFPCYRNPAPDLNALPAAAIGPPSPKAYP